MTPGEQSTSVLWRPRCRGSGGRDLDEGISGFDHHDHRYQREGTARGIVAWNRHIPRTDESEKCDECTSKLILVNYPSFGVRVVVTKSHTVVPVVWQSRDAGISRQTLCRILSWRWLHRTSVLQKSKPQ